MMHIFFSHFVALSENGVLGFVTVYLHPTWTVVMQWILVLTKYCSNRVVCQMSTRLARLITFRETGPAHPDP